MSVLSRDALEASPLADLHAIASELAIDGFRRLRKADLVDAILGHQDAEDEGEAATTFEDAEDHEARPRRRRGGRGRGRRAVDADLDAGEETVEEPDEEAESDEVEADAVAAEQDAAEVAPRERRSRRGGAGRRSRGDEERADEAEPVAEGVVELAGNGAAFIRLDDQPDVYVSAAQVRRCELVDGDRVGGPVRRPRRSERYPSLVRVDTINGAPAEEVAAGTPFEDLPAAWPSERLALDSDDPTLKAVEWLTPFGRGSRVAIVGPARSGKSETLRRLATALGGLEGLDVSVVLLGARPEEVHDWREAPAGGVPPAAALTFAASADAQGQALERTVDSARRQAARGAHAVVLVDGLDGIHPPAARKALASSRNIPDGGSLTIVATATQPLGGETTVIALDPALTATGSFPALDLVAGGTLRPELLVGEAGAEEIARARAEALEQRVSR